MPRELELKFSVEEAEGFSKEIASLQSLLSDIRACVAGAADKLAECREYLAEHCRLWQGSARLFAKAITAVDAAVDWLRQITDIVDQLVPRLDRLRFPTPPGTPTPDEEEQWEEPLWEEHTHEQWEKPQSSAPSQGLAKEFSGVADWDRFPERGFPTAEERKAQENAWKKIHRKKKKKK
jgi:hypothetical protein